MCAKLLHFLEKLGEEGGKVYCGGFLRGCGVLGVGGTKGVDGSRWEGVVSFLFFLKNSREKLTTSLRDKLGVPWQKNSPFVDVGTGPSARV